MTSRDLDAITILDKFVEEHPDFSPFGAKGSLSLTGYCGILGYRTQTEKENQSAAHEENRQKEREAVKPIIEELKRTGWTFGSLPGGISIWRKNPWTWSRKIPKSGCPRWANWWGPRQSSTTPMARVRTAMT